MYSIPTARGRYAVPKWGWGGGVGAGGDMIKEGVLREISIHGRYFVVWRVGRWNNYQLGKGIGLWNWGHIGCSFRTVNLSY